MTTVKISAGATFDTASPQEVEQITRRTWSQGFQEMAAGVKLMRFGASAAVAAGAVTIPPAQGAQLPLGPAKGYTWAVERLSAFGLSFTAASQGTPAQPPGVPVGFVVSPTGPVTTPVGGTVLATTTTAVPAGTYTIPWHMVLTGTLTSTDEQNIGIFVGGTRVATAVNGLNVGTWYGQDTVTVTVPGGGAIITAQTLATGSTGAVYQAGFAVTSDPVGTAATAGSNGTVDVLNVHRVNTDGSQFLGQISYTVPWLHIGGRGMLLRNGEFLLITGTGLAATGTIQVNGEGVETPADQDWKLAT